MRMEKFTTAADDASPFDLDAADAYARWREGKLERYPSGMDRLVVEIRDPRRLSQPERAALLDRCRRANMAVYVSRSGDAPDKDIPRLLGEQLGLVRLDDHMGADDDAISSLTVRSDALRRGYIPYSNRPITWHTDGYYNPPDHQIRGMILHCVRPAAQGGENELLDHEMAYIMLRDQSPDYVRALMDHQVMTIPANVVDGVELRPDQSGPVFSVAPDGCLHMRYTDRKRNIRWREDPVAREAVAFLKDRLHRRGPWHFRGKLEAGWGLVCNNVLHTRAGFEDGERPRLLYRARYYDRINGT
jgi:hypothetical protein